MRVDKSEIRTQIRAARRQLRAELGDAAWSRRAQQLAEDALEVPQVSQACIAGATIASYLSYANEPPTDALNAALSVAGARVVLPITDRDGVEYPDLAWIDLDAAPDAPIVGRGASGLTELGCEVVLLPALAVDEAGNRLGQGGGFYDRMLPRLPRLSGPVRIAVIGPGEVLGKIPTEPHDQPVDTFILG